MNCVLSAKGGDPDQLGEPGACRFSGEATDPIYFELGPIQPQYINWGPIQTILRPRDEGCLKPAGR